MKVLQLTTHLNMGGVARYILDISNGIKKSGAACFVGSSGGDLEAQFREDGVELVFLDIKTKFEFHPKIFFEARRLSRFVKLNNIDIMHAHTRVAQVTGCLVSSMTGVPLVSTCHGFFNPGRLSRRIAPCWGKRVIAISDNVKKHLTDDFSVAEGIIDVIYNGVDPHGYIESMSYDEKDRFKRELKMLGGPVIGTVGRLSPVKGYNYLLHALKTLKAYFPGINLLVIGDGPQKNFLKSLTEELGLRRNVYFMETRVDARKFLPFMDVYVFPSVQEGLGLSLLEAMASRRACVATDVGGIPNVIENGENGLLVPPADANKIADAVKKLLEDQTLREKLASNAKSTVAEKFSINNTISATMLFYKKVVDAAK